MRVNMPDADEFYSGEELAEEMNNFREMSRTGAVPMFLPGPASFFFQQVPLSSGEGQSRLQVIKSRLQ